MKIFVTGVSGQLGHDTVNELISRGHEAIGSDIAPHYAGIKDGSAVTKVPYVQSYAGHHGGVRAVKGGAAV